MLKIKYIQLLPNAISTTLLSKTLKFVGVCNLMANSMHLSIFPYYDRILLPYFQPKLRRDFRIFYVQQLE